LDFNLEKKPGTSPGFFLYCQFNFTIQQILHEFFGKHGVDDGSVPISVSGVAGFAAAYMLDNSCPVSSILNHLYSRGTPLCLNLFYPKYGIKTGVSAVKPT